MKSTFLWPEWSAHKCVLCASSCLRFKALLLDTWSDADFLRTWCQVIINWLSAWRSCGTAGVPGTARGSEICLQSMLLPRFCFSHCVYLDRKLGIVLFSLQWKVMCLGARMKRAQMRFACASSCLHFKLFFWYLGVRLTSYEPGARWS